MDNKFAELIEEMFATFEDISKNAKAALAGNKAAGKRLRLGLVKLKKSVTPINKASLGK